jgi:16S rRNA (guanine527-N7)-methyltransferase
MLRSSDYSLLDDCRAALAAAGVESAHLEKLALYCARVLATNKSFNLTGAKTVQDFIPLVLDSIEIAPEISESLIDVGSGGGLPAIPLAIVTGVPVTMVETTLKKARFLESVLEELGLTGRVVGERAEDAGHDPTLRGHFHVGTAKAVASAPVVAEYLLPLIKPGGKAVLQRGTIDEREYNALCDASLMLGGQVVTPFPKTSKSVIIVEKKAQTQQRFPRRVGIPSQKPLCM